MNSERTEVMHRVLSSFPVQIKQGLLQERPAIEVSPSHLLVCGMGGSALAGLILKQYTRAHGSHAIDIHRDYNLPPWVDATTLVVALSYSGNTEEVLSAFDQAQDQSLPLVAISTGGALQEKAVTQDVPWIELPHPDDISAFQPRYSVPAQCGLLTALLADTVGEDHKEDMVQAADALNPDQLEEGARSIAEGLDNKTAVIYTSNTLAAVGYNWKIQLNETAKRHAFHNIFPEANHNEIAATDNDQFHFIFLHHSGDHPRVKQRLELLHRMHDDAGYATTFLDLSGATQLEQIFNGVLLGWWTAFSLAERGNVDPLAVDSIENFKQQLAQ